MTDVERAVLAAWSRRGGARWRVRRCAGADPPLPRRSRLSTPGSPAEAVRVLRGRAARRARRAGGGAWDRRRRSCRRSTRHARSSTIPAADRARLRRPARPLPADRHHRARTAAELLEWLERYTLPCETRFADPAHARRGRRASSSTSSCATARRPRWSSRPCTRSRPTRSSRPRGIGGMRLIAGKVLMDRNCPELAARHRATRGYEATADADRALARAGPARLRGDAALRAGRRPSEQLELAGAAARRAPGRVAADARAPRTGPRSRGSRELFPWRRSYLDVYDRFGLLRPGACTRTASISTTRTAQRMAASGAAMAFCPTSNLFLGSGLFDLAGAQPAGVRVGLGTDVGGGHQLQHAADARRGLQGGPARRRDAHAAGGRSTSRRWAARARWVSRRRSGASSRAARPTSSCSIRRRRRSSRGGWRSRARSRSGCSPG